MRQTSIEACMLKVNKLISELRNKTDFPHANNFYVNNSMTVQNLKIYFHAMLEMDPEILFIGEAPGVHGAVRTGIPFTSERIIQEKQTKNDRLFSSFIVEDNKYERSSSIMWNEIVKLPRLPLMWNIMPLHPYRMDNKGIINNRSPNRMEKDWGKSILFNIIEIFPKVDIYSVGRHAQRALEELDIETSGHVTHPVLAHQFREDFKALFLS